jgi:hypothetical protein
VHAELRGSFAEMSSLLVSDVTDVSSLKSMKRFRIG